MRNNTGGDRYRPGDHLVIDDRTGFTEYASRTRKEWNGGRVSTQVFERRHPQDFVRGKTDRQAVADPRSPGPAMFIGPLTTTVTASAAAGENEISVASSVRFEAGDTVWIMLDNGDRFRTIVQSVPDAETIVLTANLPWSTSAGMQVIDITANAEADIG